MTEHAAVASAPKLLKARMRHTRLLIVALVPMMALSRGMLEEASLAREMMQWAGYALVIFCVLGRAYCSAFIGGRKNDELVQQGPFGTVRNPLYVFSFLGIIGIGLQSGTVTLPVLLAAVFMTYYPRVVAKEEAFLRHKFGAAYEDYMRRVPRWRPDFSLWQEPEEVPARPRFLRETMQDAALFFLALPCFEVIAQLQAAGWLPVLMSVP